jgi:Lrp/AsnC family leucine-responsive transcriptional regulator
MPVKARTKRASAELLDDVNRRLLVELQADGRLTVAELARRVSLSAPAVSERLDRLERGGAITGYHAAVDPRVLGYGLTAIIRIRPASHQHHKVVELAQQAAEVVQCDRVTGEDCYMIRLHLRDVGHLSEVLDRFLPFGETTTSIVQASPVPARGVSPRSISDA